MHRFHVGPLSRARLYQEVQEITDSLARSGVLVVSVTVTFGADPEGSLFGVPIPVATDLLPEYVRGLEADRACRFGESNITIEVGNGDGVEVVFANDNDIYLRADEGLLLTEVCERWAIHPNYCEVRI